MLGIAVPRPSGLHYMIIVRCPSITAERSPIQGQPLALPFFEVASEQQGQVTSMQQLSNSTQQRPGMSLAPTSPGHRLRTRMLKGLLGLQIDISAMMPALRMSEWHCWPRWLSSTDLMCHSAILPFMSIKHVSVASPSLKDNP